MKYFINSIVYYTVGFFYGKYENKILDFIKRKFGNNEKDKN